jgi:hypothetical protein
MTHSALTAIAPEPLALFYMDHLHKQTSSALNQNFDNWKFLCGLNEENKKLFRLKNSKETLQNNWETACPSL